MAFPFCFRLLVLVYLLIHSLSLFNPHFSVPEYCIYYFGIVRIDRKKWEIIFSALRFLSFVTDNNYNYGQTVM